MKYTSCFKSISFKSLANDYSSDERVKIIRKHTWHKTLVANNTIPSVDAMNLSSQRLKFVLENINLLLQHTMTDPTKHSWIYESGSLKCVWDSEKSNSEIAFQNKKWISVKKGAAKVQLQKSRCKNKMCVCVSDGKVCSSLCQCTDCENSSSEEEEEIFQEMIDSDMDLEDGKIFDKMISDF